MELGPASKREREGLSIQAFQGRGGDDVATSSGSRLLLFLCGVVCTCFIDMIFSVLLQIK